MSNQSKLTLDEAKLRVQEKYTDYEIKSSVDFDNLFVFNLVPKGADSALSDSLLENPVAIEKDGEHRTLRFHPLDHNPSAYMKAVNDTIVYY